MLSHTHHLKLTSQPTFTIDDGQIYTRDGRALVQRIVLTTFVASCPTGMQCRHLDGNPTNNHVLNLAWGTRSENEQDKLLHGTDNRGERHGMVKLTATNILEIRSRAANGERILDIAKDFPLTKGSIYDIVNRRTWKHI